MLDIIMANVFIGNISTIIIILIIIILIMVSVLVGLVGCSFAVILRSLRRPKRFPSTYFPYRNHLYLYNI